MASRFTEKTNRHCLSVCCTLLHPTMQCTRTERHLAQVCTIYLVDLFDWGRITFVCDQAKNGYLWNIFCKSCFALISCTSHSSSFYQRKCFNYIYLIVIIRQRSKYFPACVGETWVQKKGPYGNVWGFYICSIFRMWIWCRAEMCARWTPQMFILPVLSLCIHFPLVIHLGPTERA